MNYSENTDWLQYPPAWRDKEIHDCLCGIKTALEDYFASQAAQPLIYRALLTQSGTDDPTGVEGENTTGSAITFQRTGTGNGRILSDPPCFTIGKTHVYLTLGSTNNSKMNGFQYYKINDTSRIDFATFSNPPESELTGNFTDSILDEASLTILIYP